MSDDREERRVEIVVRLVAQPFGSPWERAVEMLRADGCDGPIEYLSERPDYEGAGDVRLTYRSTRPRPTEPRHPLPGDPEDDSPHPRGAKAARK